MIFFEKLKNIDYKLIHQIKQKTIFYIILKYSTFIYFFKSFFGIGIPKYLKLINSNKKNILNYINNSLILS